MISFVISLIALVLGYLFYGKFIERLFCPDNRQTPAIRLADGVDYIAMPTWRVFMIQFLNIAGTGPIFGAIMGAKFGPSAYLWIVFGCIFAGAVHDYLSGMLSLRNDGAGLPELVGKYLGRRMRRLMLVFTLVALILVGSVFVKSPADILSSFFGQYMWLIAAIFFYYIIATLLPVDKIIGKIYPLFALTMLFMAAALLVVLLLRWYDLPEVWETGFVNMGKTSHPETFVEDIFPALFITISCGAISGAHGTQSPLMARCIKSEKAGRPVFYGAMITEGFVALIWATVAMYFFYNDPAGYETLEGAQGFATGAPLVVKLVCKDWLGMIGGVIAVFGVIAAAVTSGDTAFRSGRLIVAEFLHIEQRSVSKRLMISIPMFCVAIAIIIWQMNDVNGFNVLWNTFGCANQALAVFTLWTVTVYLAKQGKLYWVSLIPAVFMTAATSCYLCVGQCTLDLPNVVGYVVAAALCTVLLIIFFTKTKCSGKKIRQN